MAQPSNGAERFRVDIASHLAERIETLNQAAKALGHGSEFLKALRQILERLETAPFSAGEAVYALPSLELTVRMIVQPPIVLHYAVHAQRRLVWFSAIDLLL